MKYQSRDLLTLLISLFIFNACENPRSVGLDVDPGNEVLGALTDTVTVHAVTQKDDPAMTRTPADSTSINKPTLTVSQLGFGYLNDPILGETSSDIAFLLVKPVSGDARIPEHAVIDSAVLVFGYGASLYGDSTASHTLQVRRLDEPFITSNFYNSTKTWNVENDVVGSASISHFALRDSVTITSFIDNKDSVIRVAPQVRIPLQTSFVNDLLSQNLDSTMMNTDLSFFAHQKGLYLSVNKTQSSGLGSLATLAANDNSGLELRYKVTDEEGNIDTVYKRYPLSMNIMAMSSKHDYSSAVLEQLNNPNGNYTTVYSQGMGGLRTKFSFPYLHTLKDQNLVINKAELVVYVDEDNLGDEKLAPAPRLTLYRHDIAGRNQPVPDGDARPQPDHRSLFGFYQTPVAFGGFYDSTNKRYVFVLTSFIQDILLGRLNNSDVYLSPILETINGIPYSSDANRPARSVLGGGSNQNFKTKLNIYYSKSNN